MSAETKDYTRVRTPSDSIGVMPALATSFWINWLLAAMAGEIVGRVLSQIYLHRTGRVIAALLLCFFAMSTWQGTTRRLTRTIFWTAAFLLSLLGAVLAKTTDISMGGGDIGAIVLTAILLMFSFVICYRLTGNAPSPADCSNARGYFWITALLAQTLASACADWFTDPGGPSERQAIAVIALGIAATIVAYGCMHASRSLLFWPAFILSGTLAALGGHVVPNQSNSARNMQQRATSSAMADLSRNAIPWSNRRVSSPGESDLRWLDTALDSVRPRGAAAPCIFRPAREASI